MVASPDPQMAFTRLKTYGVPTTGLCTMIGATTGPGRGNACPFAAGALGGLSGPALPGFAGGGGGISLKYFNANSEMMSCFSDTFAFNWNDASWGIAKTTSPAMLVKPYEPDLASGPVIVTVPLTVFAVTFGLLIRFN